MIIQVPRKVSFAVGSLGVLEFLRGYYVYAGSALNGLNARLERHLRTVKKNHWHIDFLLEHARIIEIWYCFSGERLECKWNTAITKLPGVETSVDGFGSSDCQCPSHLTMFAQRPLLTEFKQEICKSGWPEVLLRA